MRGEGEREGREPEGAPSPAPGRPSSSAAAPQAGGNSEARSSRIADRKAEAVACAAQGTRAGRMGGWGCGAGALQDRTARSPRPPSPGGSGPCRLPGWGLHCLPARLLLSPGLASLTSLGRAGSAHVWESSVRLASLGGFGRVVYPAPHPASSARWSFRASQQGDGNN